MAIIDSIFQPVIGKMGWGVKNGVGSSLTFEFGDPHFKVIREPYLSKSKKPGGIRQAARRMVAIQGDWHLWIWSCDWRFFRNHILIGDSESPKKELKQIALDLETQPYLEEGEETEPEEQWLLYQPSGMVFTLRSDGKYNHHMGNQPTPDDWIPCCI